MNVIYDKREVSIRGVARRWIFPNGRLWLGNVPAPPYGIVSPTSKENCLIVPTETFLSRSPLSAYLDPWCY